VNLSSSSVPATGLTVGFSLSSLVLNTKAHFTANSTVTFSSSSPNVYNVTITGTSTTAGHPPVSFNAIVNVQGYTLSPNPSSFFREKWGDTFTSTVSLTALTGFSGTVNLAVQPLTGFAASFNPASVPLTAGGTGSSVLTFTLGTPAPGNVTAIVTGSSTVSGGKLVNTANVLVQVVGLICIADPSGFTTSCPTTQYIFSGPPIVAPQTAATQIRVGVFAQALVS
jgi:hypothetical protein